MKITIGHLYPEQLNLYGDRGNIQCLVKRCHWRDMKTEIRTYDGTEKIDFNSLDIVLAGGGPEWAQRQVSSRLHNCRHEFRDYIEDYGVVIALCGAYPMLGHYYETEEGRVKGLSLLDIYTEGNKQRAISNIVLENPAYPLPIVGFENHGGHTFIGEHQPLGRVLYGKGNNGQDGTEGVLYKNVIASYLHGPLLPKNPHICDAIIANALRRKYGEAHLTPLDDRTEIEANQYLYSRFVKSQTDPINDGRGHVDYVHRHCSSCGRVSAV